VAGCNEGDQPLRRGDALEFTMARCEPRPRHAAPNRVEKFVVTSTDASSAAARAGALVRDSLLCCEQLQHPKTRVIASDADDLGTVIEQPALAVRQFAERQRQAPLLQHATI
jgi:hypothetical protein